MRFLALAGACLMLAACTTTNVRNAATEGPAKPIAATKGLLVQPDVQLALLTATGIAEPREDWSRASQANLAASIDGVLKSRSHSFTVLDPQTSMEGRTGQLLRLNEAVGASILAHDYGALKLPTKKDGFNWTLGEGAAVLGAANNNSDYALFVTARGSYSSAGRKAMMVGAAMLGVGLPMATQQVYCSLVDLKTGKVVWFNVATAGASADMRSPEGAKALAEQLMKGAPL